MLPLLWKDRHRYLPQSHSHSPRRCPPHRWRLHAEAVSQELIPQMFGRRRVSSHIRVMLQPALLASCEVRTRANVCIYCMYDWTVRTGLCLCNSTCSPRTATSATIGRTRAATRSGEEQVITSAGPRLPFAPHRQTLVHKRIGNQAQTHLPIGPSWQAAADAAYADMQHAPWCVTIKRRSVA